MKWINVKDKVSERINDRLEELNIKGRVTLIDGIFNHHYSQESSKEVLISGPSIPSVMLIENETGKIHWFAIKALITKEEYLP